MISNTTTRGKKYPASDVSSPGNGPALLLKSLIPADQARRAWNQMSKLSLELRWFFRGLVPGEVQTWFSRKLPADRPQKAKVRQDLYFIVRDREDLGLKLSRGRLELKCRQESQPFSLSEPRMSGVQETWIKQEWRYAKEFADNLEVAFGKPKLQGWRVEVQKNRSMRKYQVDAGGKVLALAMDKPAEWLFKIELNNL